MSSSPVANTDNADTKLATGPAVAGMDSITSTHGMHPTANEDAPPNHTQNSRHAGSCDQPGCTTEHSGKTHE